jgi:hypothetical protein
VTTETGGSRIERLLPVFVAVLAVLAGANAVDASPLGVVYDDAHYAILGRALAFGDGYRYLNIPGAPVGTHFPPGYPAFLALLWRIEPGFPGNIALFKMANAVLLGAVALATYALSRRHFGLAPLVAAFAALAGTVTIPALVLSSTVMSETLFLAVLLPILLSSERAIENGGVKTAVWVGLAAGAATLVRSHAVALIAALVVTWLLRRRPREAAASAAAALMVLTPWLLWVRHYDPLMPEAVRPQYGSYTGWFIDGLRSDGLGLLWGTLVSNTSTSLAIIARSFSPARNIAFDALAVSAVLTLSIAGAVAAWRRSRVLVLFLAFYLGITLVWPFSPLRFLWGVWPLLVLLMVSGAMVLWGAGTTPRARSASRAASAAAVVIALAGALVFNVRGYANAWWATSSRSLMQRIQPTIVWVAEHSQPDDVIVADDEGAVFLYTGRRAVPAGGFSARLHVVPRTPAEDAAFLGQLLDAFRPNYVVAWSVPTLNAARSLAGTKPPRLDVADTIPGGSVFRRVDAAAVQPR